MSWPVIPSVEPAAAYHPPPHLHEGRDDMRRGRRVLRGIERDLAHSDLRLSMLFESFTELAKDADMPGTERIGTKWLRLFGRLGRHADRHQARDDRRASAPGD